MSRKGTFIISLDFELYWGMHDVLSKEAYRENLLGTPDAVTAILHTFNSYQIHATWAIVGMLYGKSVEDIRTHFPMLTPSYHNKTASAYDYLDNNSITPSEAAFFFAPGLIDTIKESGNQEIATHTFSHYYTLENGQTVEEFSADLTSAVSIARENGDHISSIVFPRNQVNTAYLAKCIANGITCYRGTETSFIHQVTVNDRKKYFIRAFRLLDRYMNVFGHHTYQLNLTKKHSIINVPSSRFLTSYSPKLRMFEALRLRRIKHAMTHAAKHGEIFHLWWHPHNFGVHLQENILFLNKVLQHYQHLHTQYGFTSKNMQEAATSYCTIQ